MTRPGPIALAVLLLAELAAAPADEPNPLADARRLEEAGQGAIARAEPAVVCLNVYRGSTPIDARGDANGTDPGARVPEYFGTGVVIDAKGLILTNYHVVRDANVQVRLADGGLAQARLLAGDNFSDLAVLDISSRAPRGLTAMPLGAGDKLRKGNWVIALGHPYAAGFRDGSPSASWGIVSNLRRRVPGGTSEVSRKDSLSHYATLIQTDARVQLGQSGGALIDLEGNLVGLTTAQAALTGYEAPGGFALPVDVGVRRIISVLARGEEVEYGFLGVTTSARGDPHGAGVALQSVVPNSPASKARLMPNDVILEVNGQPVREHDDLVMYLSCGLAGRRSTLLIQRGGSRKSVDVELAKVPPKAGGWGYAANKSKEYYGLRIDYASTLGHENRMADGVVVREYSEPMGSGRDKPRLAEKQLITHVNGKPVDSPADFYRVADEAVKAGKVLKITVKDSAEPVTLP